MNRQTIEFLKNNLLNKLNQTQTNRHELKGNVIHALSKNEDINSFISTINAQINNQRNDSFFSPWRGSRLKYQLANLSVSLTFFKSVNPDFASIQAKIIAEINSVPTQRHDLKNQLIKNIRESKNLGSMLTYIKVQIDANPDGNWRPGKIFAGSRLRQKLVELHTNLQLVKEFQDHEEKLKIEKNQTDQEYANYLINDKNFDTFFAEDIQKITGSRALLEQRLRDWARKIEENLLMKADSSALALFYSRLEMFSELFFIDLKPMFEYKDVQSSATSLKDKYDELYLDIEQKKSAFTVIREKRLQEVLKSQPHFQLIKDNRATNINFHIGNPPISLEMYATKGIDFYQGIQMIASNFVEREVEDLNSGLSTSAQVKENVAWMIDKLCRWAKLDDARKEVLQINMCLLIEKPKSDYRFNC